MALVHLFAVGGLLHLNVCKTETLIGAFVFYIIGGFGVTGGMHRFYSHKSYECSLIVRILLMFCASVANQGTIHHWVRDHRLHHAFSETEADPHNAKRGFFFSHMGWLLTAKSDEVKKEGRKIDMTDIDKMFETRIQKALDPFWNLFWCFGFPTLIAVNYWNEDPMIAFMVMGALKYVSSLHFTWFVNSWAHLYGDRPYDEHINPSEQPFVALVSMGEGWHNYHHAYPFDYAASELGASQQYNPTKLIIDTFALFGLVWNRRRYTDKWNERCERKGLKQSTRGIPPFQIRTTKKL